MQRALIKNSRKIPFLFWLEPWAEQFEIAPGSTIELRYECSDSTGAGPEVEITDELFVWYFGSGCRVQVRIDGRDVTSPASWTVPAP